jgi:hypothetical protein
MMATLRRSHRVGDGAERFAAVEAVGALERWPAEVVAAFRERDHVDLLDVFLADVGDVGQS